MPCTMNTLVKRSLVSPPSSMPMQLSGYHQHSRDMTKQQTSLRRFFFHFPEEVHLSTEALSLMWQCVFGFSSVVVAHGHRLNSLMTWSDNRAGVEEIQAHRLFEGVAHVGWTALWMMPAPQQQGNSRGQEGKL